MDDDGSQVESWLRSIPELASREKLVNCLRETPTLRRCLFRMHEDLICLPAMIAGHRIAVHILMYIYQHQRRHLTEYWQDRLDHRVYNQAVGFLKNVHKNAKVRLPKCGSKPRFNEHDIRRKP